MSDDAESRARERVGTVLNEKWTLERLLGIGGMAAVYAARHRNGARGAVKVLHPGLSCHKEVRERFLREGYAANRVEHPGAVKVTDDDVVPSGPDAGTAYLVMEILDGESLQDRLERGPPVGEREFLNIAEAVLEVLEAAHARGVVHRDLKPENLFLVRGSAEAPPPARVKVLDFGLARLLDGQTITSYGLALGTPSFMSPEQAGGRIDEIDGRTDLFSLAATGFRLRTGRRLHEGANPVELVTKMANLPAPRIRTMAPDVSEPFARVIDRALEFCREDRYPNATAMLEAVRGAMAELDGVARTMAAVPAAPPVRPPEGEGTLEVSEGDIEAAESSAPVKNRQVESASGAARGSSSELPVVRMVRPRRRRSILPWVTLLLFGGIAAKLWLDARDATTSPVAPASSLLPSDVAPAAAPPPSAPALPEDAPEPDVQAPARAAAPVAPALPTAHAVPAHTTSTTVHRIKRRRHPGTIMRSPRR